MIPFDTPVQALSVSTALALGACETRLNAAGQSLARRAARFRKSPAALPTAIAAGWSLAARSASAQTAGGTGSLDSFLTNVVNMITGTTGQAIAIIAVAVCGLGAMFGALSARAFGGVVLGCAIVFSAGWIVGKITGSGT